MVDECPGMEHLLALPSLPLPSFCEGNCTQPCADTLFWYPVCSTRSRTHGQQHGHGAPEAATRLGLNRREAQEVRVADAPAHMTDPPACSMRSFSSFLLGL